MPERLDLKNVVEGVISSYETRIESISFIFEATPPILNDLQESILNTKEEREKINTQLRDILARKEHLRRKDFDNMMQGILSTQDQREKEVRNLLKEYFNDQKNMAQALRENLRKFKNCLARGEAQRVEESRALIKDILAKQEKRKEEITSKLRDFQKEQRDLAIRLKGLLAKGNDLRIKDFKLILKEFKAQRERRLALQKKRKEEVGKMLSNFREERQRIISSPKAINIDTQSNRKSK